MDEANEDDILITCALRFDGYRYAQEQGFDSAEAYKRLLTSGPSSFTLPEQMTLFFSLQRFLFKWGGEGLRRTAPEWRIFRELFLGLADKQVPEPYRIKDYLHQWESGFAPRIGQCIELIRTIHEQTSYQDATRNP